MTPYKQVVFEADRLGPGNHRLVCPFCQGGAEKERSLNLLITSAGNVYFRCFRASCDKRGGTFEPFIAVREPRYFTAETVSLSEDRKRWFAHRFGFVPEDTVYAPNMDRFIYKVSGPALRIRGYVARSFSGATPKVLTYNELPGEPFIGWAFPYGEGETKATVIVEDWVSAEKVASTNAAQAVALNGTNLTLEMVREISETADGTPVVLALDKDAFAKSLRYLKDYGEMFSPRLKVWKLDRDLKYETTESIQKALQDDRTDFSDDRRTAERPHERRATDSQSYYYG